MVIAGGRLPKPRLTAKLAKRVQPSTLQRYRQAYVSFMSWIVASNILLPSLVFLDYALLEYSELLDSRSDFSLILSAVVFFFPRARGHLAYASQVSKGWMLMSGVKHTVPMIRAFVCAVAQALCLAGHPRLAAGVIGQYGGWLRPSEMLGLRRSDIVLPGMHLYEGGSLYVVLGFGARSTKVKREQSVEVTWGLAIAAFRFLYRTCTGNLLVPYSYQQYYTLLAAACGAQGFQDLDFTPHSPRAGAATDFYIESRDFKRTQDRGRWMAETSARIYLDRARAVAGSLAQRAAIYNFLVSRPERIGNIFLFA